MNLLASSMTQIVRYSSCECSNIQIKGLTDILGELGSFGRNSEIAVNIAEPLSSHFDLQIFAVLLKLAVEFAKTCNIIN